MLHGCVAVFDDPVRRAPAGVFGTAGAVAVAEVAGVERGGEVQGRERVDGVRAGWEGVG